MTADDLWKAHLDTVGAFIKEQRRIAELSQRELAKMSNLSDTYMSQLERGMHEPSIRVLKSIAASLGLSAEQFIGFAAGVSEDPPGSPTLTEDAIRGDERLTEEQRKALLGVLTSFLSANEAGGTSET